MKLKNIMIFIVLITTGFSANSSEIDNTKITRTMMDEGYGQVLFIQVERDPVRDGAHCHSNGTWDYVISTESEFGKQMFSQLLAAYAAGKTIKMFGKGTCLVNSSTETLKRIELL
jgi:hypothetical protein